MATAKVKCSRRLRKPIAAGEWLYLRPDGVAGRLYRGKKRGVTCVRMGKAISESVEGFVQVLLEVE